MDWIWTTLACSTLRKTQITEHDMFWAGKRHANQQVTGCAASCWIPRCMVAVMVLVNPGLENTAISIVSMLIAMGSSPALKHKTSSDAADKASHVAAFNLAAPHVCVALHPGLGVPPRT
jgi:hypothetical protein